ncbi:pyruvate kinase PKM-like [Gigantopelta aegis]|uniref:pyruvate kinase PKM-like n=1 Tax=Gigantopelta aegis TaxID=1735272 RepID=UPI001B8899E9|nr:pyruvate kinase PKM-like [Gigantopelta aegis]
MSSEVTITVSSQGERASALGDSGGIGGQELPSKKAFTRLEHICELDIDTVVHTCKRTGVIGTIGPACNTVDQLAEMIEKGMDIVRINMAYGSFEYNKQAVENIREAESRVNQKILKPVAIAVDLLGPRARVGSYKPELSRRIKLNVGERVKFTSDIAMKDKGERDHMYVNDADFIQRTKVGDQIYIQDGPLRVVVDEKGEGFLMCTVDSSGIMGSHEQVHVPRSLPGKAQLSEIDKRIIQFTLDNDCDMIFASFVYDPITITQIRMELGTKADQIKVIAKIENYEGVKKFEEIMRLSDGAMIARGDLGIDFPPEKVFLAQKNLIGVANRLGKPVICAAQMLDSMEFNPRPTRAEASDVANAILDGADCVLLSKETAAGKHPIKSLETIVSICHEAEAAVFSDNLFRQLRTLTVTPCDGTQTIAIAAVEAALRCQASAILVITTTGRSAGLVAQYRPHCSIIAVTRSPSVAKSLHLHRGIYPILYEEEKCDDWAEDIDNRFHKGLVVARQLKVVSPGNIAILVTGWMPGTGSTNTIRTITVGDMDKHQSFTQLTQ